MKSTNGYIKKLENWKQFVCNIILIRTQRKDSLIKFDFFTVSYLIFCHYVYTSYKIGACFIIDLG